jgi:hypothetical protein
VVQLLNDDQTKLLTMFMAISDERLEPADKTVFTFIEIQPGYPLPVKEWFYPGRLNGLEFIYPKEQALAIAQHAKEPILAADNVSLHDLSSLKIEAIGPLGAEVPSTATASNTTSVTKAELPPPEEAKPTPSPAPAETPSEPVAEEKQPEQPAEAPAIAENKPPEVEQPATPAPAPAPAPATEEPAKSELPKTAGELPLIGLIGVLFLSAGLGLKLRSSRQ